MHLNTEKKQCLNLNIFHVPSLIFNAHSPITNFLVPTAKNFLGCSCSHACTACFPSSLHENQWPLLV